MLSGFLDKRQWHLNVTPFLEAFLLEGNYRPMSSSICASYYLAYLGMDEVFATSRYCLFSACNHSWSKLVVVKLKLLH
jgi:hypothetical protein